MNLNCDECYCINVQDKQSNKVHLSSVDLNIVILNNDDLPSNELVLSSKDNKNKFIVYSVLFQVICVSPRPSVVIYLDQENYKEM